MNNLEFISKVYEFVTTHEEQIKDKNFVKSVQENVRIAMNTVVAGLKGDKLIIDTKGSVVTEHANGGTSTIAKNTEYKDDKQKEIPFQDTASPNKKEDSSLADSGSGEKTTAAVLETATDSAGSDKVESEETVEEKALVDAEADISKNSARLSAEEAHDFLKEYIRELHGKGKGNNNSSVREEINQLMIDIFPLTDPVTKENKHGGTSRNKLQDAIWREVKEEAKKKAIENEQSSISDTAKSAVSNILDKAKSLLTSDKKDEQPPVVNEDPKPEESPDLSPSPELEIKPAILPDNTKELSPEEIAKGEIDESEGTATDNVEKVESETKPDSNVININGVDITKCDTKTFVGAVMKEILELEKAEDFEEDKPTFQKWLSLLKSRPDLPISGDKATDSIRAFFKSAMDSKKLKKVA
jgi:hypothetical protein